MAINAVPRLLFAGLWLATVGCSGDPVGELIAQLSNPDVVMRRAAALALGKRAEADERVVAALAGGVADDDAEVRGLSIDALGARGSAARSSLPALASALQEAEPGLRVRAALAMQHIDPSNADSRPVIIEAMRTADGRVLRKVGAMGQDAAWAVPTLVGLLSHELAAVRALAAETLGRIGPAADPSAAAALRRSLQDANAAVQGAARDALERIQRNSASPVSR
jgi:HEAT repeat protein